MDKVIEQLMMEREPVHPKCQGKGFTDEERNFLHAPWRCDRIESISMFDIIDEETGQIDDEAAAEDTNADPACRCTAYVNPSNWWRGKNYCPLASHFRPQEKPVSAGKVRAGQQKQKKKSRR